MHKFALKRSGLHRIFFEFYSKNSLFSTFVLFFFTIMI